MTTGCKYCALWLSACLYLLTTDNLADVKKSTLSQQFDHVAALVTNIDFSSNAGDVGVIVFELSNPNVKIDVEKTESSVGVKFFETELAEHLKPKLNLRGLGTPVTDIDVIQQGLATVVTINVIAPYNVKTYRDSEQYILRVEPLVVARVESISRADFTGEPLSLNFHNIELRSVLQIIADFTSLNLVVSDSVTGSITLHLDQVPWDQALETILNSKGLGKRQLGNIVMIAPAAEIAEQERLQIEANRQSQQLATLETTFLRIKYADASAIYKLFVEGSSQIASTEERGGGNGESILSKRGRAVVDERTNTIILTDTTAKIAGFKRLVAEIDIPIKQVLIEARIVIANTDFKKELGVIWGLAGIDKLSGSQFSSISGDRSLSFSGRRSGLAPGAGVAESFTYQTDEVEVDPGPDGIAFTKDDVTKATRNYDFGLSDSLAIDLGITNPSGSFSLGYLTDNLLIDLELSALESDGYAEIVSQPKVLTADKQQAVIKSGTEIAYQKASSSGATSIEFKEAVLQLEVTPQITPDNHIIVDLMVSQDSVGAFTPSGEPAIDITQIETQVLVGDGQTLVLGGIFHTEEVKGSEKVPILGDIPFFGRLFRNDLRNTEKREILIFLTPKIIDDNLLDR
jgi:type IV pilus assembly protein PilQ